MQSILVYELMIFLSVEQLRYMIDTNEEYHKGFASKYEYLFFIYRLKAIEKTCRNLFSIYLPCSIPLTYIPLSLDL